MEGLVGGFGEFVGGAADHIQLWQTNFPGLADLTGTRVLAELGNDRTRFADARALKTHAGTAPITRASGLRLPASIRSSGPIRPPPQRRRSALQRATQHLQPNARLPLSLPAGRQGLRRTRSVPGIKLKVGDTRHR
ncbi:transposase [Nonomuraea cavernae]|uniref:transposase n=1 Tax=Nonomuraea cavernae TaxID=2045107 RepID=UPI001CDA3290|nr:transposase [Nonomuraea cavernae]